ncbi:MAG TPA: GNAT family N-acetyltransferase [Micromonosporaceae bacterium]|nr:GNAT family N-acetyltransferase [Micromonosporaceae bacterium]
MTEAVTVRPGRASDVGDLAVVIARAFGPLPLSAWLVPDAGARLAAMAGQFRLVIAAAIDDGDVYVAGDGVGVAVWFPAGPLPDIPGYDAALEAACGRYAPRFAELDDAMHKMHPGAPDHAYLAFLAVEREWQQRGIGSALLDVHHRRLDAAGTPAYLEASGLQSRRLYVRKGYVDHAEPYGPADLSVLYPMWREPA